MKVKRHNIWPVAIVLAIFLVSGTKDLATPDFDFYLSYDKLAQLLSVDLSYEQLVYLLDFDFSSDKLIHLLVFGLLATAVLRIPHFFNQGWRGVAITIALISLYGALDEYRQSFTPGRYVELDDWIADTLGAILASIFYYKWHWYRRILECRCFKRATGIGASPIQ